MKIHPFQQAISLYLTGSADSSKLLLKEKNNISFSAEEYADFETDEKSFNESIESAKKFSNPTLNIEANLNNIEGQFRMNGLSTVSAFFSGVGSWLSEKVGFFSGLGIAGSFLGVSLLKPKALDKKFNFLSLGGSAFMRGPLHVCDSLFSKIGEKGAELIFPSVIAGGISLLTLVRTLSGKENKKLQMPFDTIGGNMGRMAIHHMDSMLASTASKLSTVSPTLSAFLGSSIATLGLSANKKVKGSEISWNTVEGFVSLGSTHFVDSLFSNIGNALSSNIDSVGGMAMKLAGVFGGIPLVGNALGKWDNKFKFASIEGKLIKSLFRVPEAFLFNLGSVLGSSKWGIPLVGAYSAGATLLASNKNAKSKLESIKLKRETSKGLFQRLPFDFLLSLSTAAGKQISDYLPAPLVTLVSPALSFKFGEKLKEIRTSYDDPMGLSLRYAVHTLETINSTAAYKAGRMFSDIEAEGAGSILGDGRWIGSDGRIVQDMALGKQQIECGEKNLLSIALSAVAGLGMILVGKQILTSKAGASSHNSNSAQVRLPKPNVDSQFVESANRFSKKVEKERRPVKSSNQVLVSV